MTDLDKALLEYYETFGVEYPLVITDMRPSSYHIKRIRESIKTGIKAEKEPLNANFDY